jgi:hypothetical protein
MTLPKCLAPPQTACKCIVPKRDDEDDEPPIEGNDNLPVG